MLPKFRQQKLMVFYNAALKEAIAFSDPDEWGEMIRFQFPNCEQDVLDYVARKCANKINNSTWGTLMNVKVFGGMQCVCVSCGWCTTACNEFHERISKKATED